LIVSAVFAQLSGVTSMQTQTMLHVTSVAAGHIYALCAGDAA